MRNAIGIFLLLLLAGCCAEPTGLMNTPMSTDDVSVDAYKSTQEVSVVILPYAAELAEKERVYLHNSYVYRNDEGNFVIWLDFTSQLILDVQGVRSLMVHLVEGLLDRLNQNGELYKPWGAPFTYNDLYVSIEFESYFGRYIDPLYVGRSELCEGFLTAFYANTALDRRACVYHKHVEAYASSKLFIDIDDGIEAEKRRLHPVNTGPRLITLIEEKSTQSNVPKVEAPLPAKPAAPANSSTTLFPAADPSPTPRTTTVPVETAPFPTTTPSIPVTPSVAPIIVPATPQLTK